MVSLELQDGGILSREEVPSSDVVRERFGYLDGLRSLAILAVLVAEVAKHANLFARAKPGAAAAYHAAGHGLDLFFLISGFGLAYPILILVHQEGRTYLDVARYVLKRLLRIVPTYYVAIALMVLVPYLAARFSLGALEGPIPSRADIIAQALFTGNGLANDGFWSLALTMRWYVLFPFLVLLWVRLPLGFWAAMAALWVVSVFTPSHAVAAGVLPAFMLGIVAADIRAQNHRIERFALPLALVAGVLAIYFEPLFATLRDSAGEPSIYTVNPAWQIALFLLLVAIGYFVVVERVLGLRFFGMVAAASYAISLVADPVTSFVSRRLSLQQIGPEGAAANAGAIAIIMGVILWQLIDRWFSDGGLRPKLVDAIAPVFRAVLSLVRAANIYYAGRGRLPTLPRAEPEIEDTSQSSGFYAPPPRGSGDLAVVMQRTGSPEQLAAEILETKKRLAEQSAALFAEADPDPPPAPPPREPERAPGFYEHGQRAAPLTAPVSIDTDPFVAAPPSMPAAYQPPSMRISLQPPPAAAAFQTATPSASQPPPIPRSLPPAYAPPPPAAQPPNPPPSLSVGYSLAQPPPAPTPELEGWLLPRSFEEDFQRAAAPAETPMPPALPGWIVAEEPPRPLPSGPATDPLRSAPLPTSMGYVPGPPPAATPPAAPSAPAPPSPSTNGGPRPTYALPSYSSPASYVPPQAPPLSAPPPVSPSTAPAPPSQGYNALPSYAPPSYVPSPPPSAAPPPSYASSNPPAASAPPASYAPPPSYAPSPSYTPPATPPSPPPAASYAPPPSYAPSSSYAPPLATPPSQPAAPPAPSQPAASTHTSISLRALPPPRPSPPPSPAPVSPPIAQAPAQGQPPPLSVSYRWAGAPQTQTPAAAQPPSPLPMPPAVASRPPQPAPLPPPGPSTPIAMPPIAPPPITSPPIASPPTASPPIAAPPPAMAPAAQTSTRLTASTPIPTPAAPSVQVRLPLPPPAPAPEMKTERPYQEPRYEPAASAPPQATPLPVQTEPRPLEPTRPAPSTAGLVRLPPPQPTLQTHEATGAQAVRGDGRAEAPESSFTRAPALPAIPGQRVTISLRPARPPIKVRIGPSPLSTPPALPSSNGKHSLDDVIDG